MTKLEALEWLIRWHKGDKIPKHIYILQSSYRAAFEVHLMKGTIVSLSFRESLTYQNMMRGTKLCNLFLEGDR